jgi:hypothetical protein
VGAQIPEEHSMSAAASKSRRQLWIETMLTTCLAGVPAGVLWGLPGGAIGSVMLAIILGPLAGVMWRVLSDGVEPHPSPLRAALASLRILYIVGVFASITIMPIAMVQAGGVEGIFDSGPLVAAVTPIAGLAVGAVALLRRPARDRTP